MPDSRTSFSRLSFYHRRDPILLEKNTFTVMILLQLCNLRKIYYQAEEFHIQVSL